VTKIVEAFLDMKRERIVDFCFYCAFSQKCLKAGTLTEPAYKLIVDVPRCIFG